MNDILSVRKEIASLKMIQGFPILQLAQFFEPQKQLQADSLIPLLYLQHGSLNAAMKDAMDILRTSIIAFERSSRQLLERYCSEPEFAKTFKASFPDADVHERTSTGG